MGQILPPSLLPIGGPQTGRVAVPFAFDFAGQPNINKSFLGHPWQGADYVIPLSSIFNNVLQTPIKSLQLTGYYNGGVLSDNVTYNPLILLVQDTSQLIMLGSADPDANSNTKAAPGFSVMIPLVGTPSSNIEFFDVAASDSNHYLQIYGTFYNFDNEPYVYKFPIPR